MKRSTLTPEERNQKQREYRAAYYRRDPERARAKTKRWAEANPERHRESTLNSHYKTTYGLTLADYKEHLIGQAGRCLICGRVPTLNLVVDHDHKTGAFRGLLCRGCNRMLGDAHDDPRVLVAGARYVAP